MSNTIDREYGEYLLQAIEDEEGISAMQLFNLWWQYAPQDVIDTYAKGLYKTKAHQDSYAQQHFASAPDLEAFAKLPEDTLGYAYQKFIVDNNLQAQIAMDYHSFHDSIAETGILDRMPDEIRYAIIRGYQQHDYFHVITGFKPDQYGEIVIQAFSLAQLHFPYFAMWVSLITARMTFMNPEVIDLSMDALTEGWRFGKLSGNMQFDKLEEMADMPLVEVRKHYNIVPEGLAILNAD